ncbi:MAG: hypothetical protein WA094_16260 [Candidatus Desulfobacillus denitrificans]
MPSNQPTWEELFALLLSETDLQATERVRSAPAESPGVEERIEFGRGLLRDLSDWPQVAPLFDVDEAVVRRIAGTTAPRPSTIDQICEAVVRTATLVMDSLSQGMQPVSGFRGGGTGRRLVFEAESVRVELSVAQKRPAVKGVTQGEVAVSGVITGIAGTKGLSVIDSAERVARHSIDEEGFFAFTTAPGIHELSVATGDEVIRLPQVELTLESP